MCSRGIRTNLHFYSQTRDKQMKTKIPSALIYPILLSSFIFTSSCALADANDEDSKVFVKKIELTADAGKEVEVLVSNGADTDVIQLDWSDKDNQQLIQDKISHLDLDIQEDILEVLNSLELNGNLKDLDSVLHDVNRSLIVINEGELDSIQELMGEHTKVFSLKKGEDLNLKGIVEIEDKLEGLTKELQIIKIQTDELVIHTDLIVKLLESGKFDRDQLDRIQASLDALR